MPAMKFKAMSHRNGEVLLSQPEFLTEWEEFKDAIRGISDEDMIRTFKKDYEGRQKSLAHTVNALIRDRLTDAMWEQEVPIFGDPDFEEGQLKRWRLDFAKRFICVEVAFNHGEATAWNLFKPVLSSELNHVKKAIQTKAGIVVFATEAMKVNGGFDGAVMTYERIGSYLRAFHNLITTPLVIVGLEAPSTFRIQQYIERGKKRGRVVPLE